MIKGIMVCVVFFSNIGCNVSSDSDDLEINSLFFVDSYQQTSENYDSPVQINATIASGEFDITYDVSEENYYMNLILNDEEMSDGGTSFYNDLCRSSLCPTTLTCRFTTELKMSCEDIGIDYPGNPEVDISSLITALPTDAYIVFKLCNVEQTKCVEQQQLVQLQ